MSETPSTRIDQHLAGLKDWRGEQMSRLRKLIMASDSSIQEDWKWETPVFTANGNVCAVGSFKESIKVNFFKGASLPDPKGLFNGGLEAKTSRSIDLTQGDKVDESAFQQLVRAAVAANARKR
jgi:hypothetical protein